MKKVVILLTAFIFIPFLCVSQDIDGLDYVSPFNDGVSAIKKGNQWAFINTEGTIVIDFRDDLVTTKTKLGNYPVFNNDRCIITQKREGISYYGYIDKFGKTIIKPQFLNALNFNNDTAVVLKLVKKDIGNNQLLNKNVVTYKYFEALIDTQGTVGQFLTEGVHIGLTSSNLLKAPVITSQIISEKLIAIKSKNKGWTIKKID